MLGSARSEAGRWEGVYINLRHHYWLGNFMFTIGKGANMGAQGVCRQIVRPGDDHTSVI